MFVYLVDHEKDLVWTGDVCLPLSSIRKLKQFIDVS